jgi:hypothetical protein
MTSQDAGRFQLTELVSGKNDRRFTGASLLTARDQEKLPRKRLPSRRG